MTIISRLLGAISPAPPKRPRRRSRRIATPGAQLQPDTLHHRLIAMTPDTLTRLETEGRSQSEIAALVDAEEALGRRHTAAIEARASRDRQARIDEQRAGLRWDRLHGDHLAMPDPTDAARRLLRYIETTDPRRSDYAKEFERLRKDAPDITGNSKP